MPSILEEFAYGNISPGSQTCSKHSELDQASILAEKLEEKLLTKRNTEEKETLEKLLDAQGEVNHFATIKQFLYGYKLGVTMTAEAFITSEELIIR